MTSVTAKAFVGSYRGTLTATDICSPSRLGRSTCRCRRRLFLNVQGELRDALTLHDVDEVHHAPVVERLIRRDDRARVLVFLQGCADVLAQPPLVDLVAVDV